MTGAMTVQSSSPIGFETLYAGYRWDNVAPQMYYVRNRFLLPTVGTWNRRDPLGYVDGVNLYRCYFVPNRLDPSGTCSGQNHHWIDKPHIGNLADLCGPFLENALLSAEQLRDMLTTWIPGGWGKGEPHESIHNPVDGDRYQDVLDDIFHESENCCEAMIRLRTLIQDTWRELTLGEGSKGPVETPFEWYPTSPFGPQPGSPIDTSPVLDLFIDFVCRNQRRPFRLPVLEPVFVPEPVTCPVLRTIPVNDPIGLPDPVVIGTGVGIAGVIWAIWEATKDFGSRACNTGCGVFMMFTPPEYRLQNQDPFGRPPMI